MKLKIFTRAVAVRRMRIYLWRRLQQYHRPNILVYAARPAYPWCRNVVFLGCPRKGFPNLWSWACCRWSLPLYLNVWLGFSIKTAPRRTNPIQITLIDGFRRWNTIDRTRFYFALKNNCRFCIFDTIISVPRLKLIARNFPNHSLVCSHQKKNFRILSGKTHNIRSIYTKLAKCTSSSSDQRKRNHNTREIVSFFFEFEVVTSDTFFYDAMLRLITTDDLYAIWFFFGWCFYCFCPFKFWNSCDRRAFCSRFCFLFASSVDRSVGRWWFSLTVFLY